MSSYPPPPPPPPPPSAPPPPPYVPGAGWYPVPNEGRATISLVLGIISLVAVCLCQPVALVCGAIAFFMGLGSRQKIRESQGVLGGDNLALGGVITGAIGGGLGAIFTVLWIVYAILIVIGAASGAFPGTSPTP